ncbi:hypothetical protein OAB29_00505 [Oceanospirillaceae bacterium]|nr:hypothetical protein [Oceanospirillaceae bacterium]
MPYTDVRFLGIRAYSDHPEVYKVADILVGAYFNKMSRIKNRALMVRNSRKLVASLLLHDDDVFRFTTKTSYFSTKTRQQVWMTNGILNLFHTAVGLGWIDVEKEAIPPYASKKSKGGMATIYSRSLVFNNLVVSIDVNDVIHDPDMLRVELKGEDEVMVELSPPIINHRNNQRTIKALNNHYKLLLDSDIRYADGRLVDKVSLFFIRKYKGGFDSGGRIYADIQNKPKTQRLGLTMKGENVGSLDISQLHPMLILRLIHGVDKERSGLLTPGLRDAYTMPDYEDLPRAVHKTLINTLFNAPSEQSAIYALMSTHWWHDEISGELKVSTYDGNTKRKGQRVFLTSPKKSSINYIESFKRHHPMYVEAIGRGLGVTLQAIDGTLIERIIEVANEAKVPLIPVHDEFIVREKDRVFIQVVLERVFRDWIGEKGQFGTIGAKWTSADGVEESVLIDLSIQS